MKAYSMTHVGLVREQNEDTVRICPGGLYILADGMGGHLAGEVASAMAADVLEGALKNAAPDAQTLEMGFRAANQAVYLKQQQDASLSGMGTTMTCLWEDGERVLIGHVGDSRAYLLLNDRLHCMTEDHSMVGEMLRAGSITAQQARNHPYRNVITRAIGTEETVRTDVLDILKTPGSRWLLCSDGLTDMVEDDKICEIMRQKTLEEAAEALIAEALLHGGRDNISVLLLEVEA